MSQDSSHPLPEQFGRYRIVKRLGQGGMGSVYLAEDTQLGRRIALKVPDFGPGDGPDARRRFLDEARTAATLDHPYLCPVHDAGEIDGSLFLTMAYIEGQSLAELIGDQGWPPRQVAALVGKLALAMQEAHNKKVIHRDLKPANVMIKTTGQRREPVIVDFGLAHRDNPEEQRLTRTGQVMGTLAYMAPEQVRGDLKEIGPACDIYALGVILYELLTGRLPFSGSGLAVAGQILTVTPLPLSAHRNDLGPALEAICMKAMAKKVEDRYPSMGELAAALTAFLRSSSADPTPTEPVLSPPTSTSDRPPQAAGSSSLVAQILSKLAGNQGAPAPLPNPDSVPFSPPLPKRRRPPWPWIVAAVALGVVALGVSLFNEPSKRITNSIGMKLVLIPAGEFPMGSSTGEDKAAPVDEIVNGQKHRVRITRPFYLGVTEVTQEQYRAVTGQNPSKFKGSDDLPVEQVSWNDAIAFCNALSEKEGLKPYYRRDSEEPSGGDGSRLPTEAEWEYACRAKNPTRYNFGDDPAALGDREWFDSNSGNQTHPVGQKRPNGFGLFDMHGNVWEWCWDRYKNDYYKESPADDPQGPSAGFGRVFRGGSWYSTAQGARSAIRRGNTPGHRSSYLGFRLARSPSGLPGGAGGVPTNAMDKAPVSQPEELLGVITRVDIAGKKLTIESEKDGKLITFTTTGDAEFVSKKGSAKIDMEKVSTIVAKGQATGKKGLYAKVTHNKGAVSKVVPVPKKAEN